MSGCLFFDIDGTLVDSEHGEIMPSSSCLEAIHKAQKNGYRCLISSGRNLGGLKEYRNLGLDGYIFSDGAGILLEGEDPILTPITDDLVQAFVHQVMDEFHGEIMMSTIDEFFASPNQYDEMIESVKKSAMHSDVSVEQLLSVFHMQPLNDYQGQAILESDVSFASDEIEKEWLKHKDDRLEYVSTTASYGRGGATTGEITMKGITKGHACKKVIEMLGCDKKQTYAFGDSMNDASMFEVCQYGIAMGNAAEELKEQADYITERIECDGIKKALQHFKII